MGLKEDIIKAFFSKLTANEELSEPVIEKLKEVFDSKEIDEEILRNIFEVNS